MSKPGTDDTGATTKGYSRRKWFTHFLSRSILQRKGRVAVAAVSVMLAAAVIVSSLGISAGIRQQLGGELKAYGANIIVTPGAAVLGDEAYANIKSFSGVEDLTAQLYATVGLNGAQVELMGVELGKVAHSAWKIEGRWPGPGEALAGADVARAFELRPGQSITLSANDEARAVIISGTVERGGPEDGALLMALDEAQALTHREGELSSVLLRAAPGRADEVAQALTAAVPGVRARTLRQVAGPEKSFLAKMELLMFLVALAVLVATGICVSSTMTATVLERLGEIGLMKALGGTRREIARFFLAESLIIGAAGGVLGCLVGYVSAQVVSQGAFGASIVVPPYVFAVGLAVSLLVAVASSVLPVRGSLRRGASDILRGG